MNQSPGLLMLFFGMADRLHEGWKIFVPLWKPTSLDVVKVDTYDMANIYLSAGHAVSKEGSS